MLMRALIGAAVALFACGGCIAAPAGTGTVLYVTMEVIGPGGHGDDCGALDDSSITANVGDHVHICYIGQNNTAQTLNVHSISNSVDGDLFTDFNLEIQPGGQQVLADFRVTVKASLDVAHTWIARESAGSSPFTATAMTHIEALAPTLALDAPSIDASGNAGSIARSALTITNAGNGDLAWHFGEAAAPGQTRAPLAPEGASTVPAYAVRLDAAGNRLVSLDMAAPGSPLLLPGTLPGAVSGGAFIDDDFSREFLLSDTDGLVTIDTTTGAVQTVNAATTPDPGDSGWLGFAWNPADRTLYALSTNGTLPSLYTIDPVTGTTLRIGEINDRTLTINGIYTALAADSDGRLFAIDATNDLLVAIARDEYSLPGRVSGYTVGPLGVDDDSISALAVDAATNTLYLSTLPTGGVSTMYTVETVTGAASAVGPIDDGAHAYVALAAVTSARPCGSAGDVAWLSLDTYIDPPLGAGASESVGVILDATDLDPGSYDAYLCLHTNDATRRQVPIPVHFTVGAAGSDVIFGTSFDGGGP
ncbi:MAG TPA: DUF4394 domain-containing protein [Rhodanobacteraceae bacterium]|nr:DUF4394 domain-containing protein [Rhodanobacteraceae bacterium]